MKKYQFLTITPRRFHRGSGQAFTLILTLILTLLSGCKSDDATQPGLDLSENTFKTHDIKTSGTAYYAFDTKDSHSVVTKPWDVCFYIDSIYSEVDDGTWMKISSPVIKSKSGSMAVIDNTDLKDVTSIPTKFSNDLAASPYIGKAWLDENNNIKKNVYIINTTSTKYYAFYIKEFIYYPSSQTLSNIKIFYKELTSTGASAVDSVVTGDPYISNYYFSFMQKAKVGSANNCDIFFSGSSLWQGIGRKCLIVQNKTLNEVTAVPTGTYTADQQITFVTQEWYSYNSTTHIIVPKTQVYVVKTASLKYAAFKITSYYNDLGKSGTFSVTWKYLQ